jgi:hypothetical protein
MNIVSKSSPDPEYVPVIFMAHQLRADSQEGMQHNIHNAKAWYQFFIRNYDVAIIADWILSCETLDDTVVEDRLRGRRSNAVLLTRSDELWICGGDISSGMRHEMLTMHALGRPIRQFIDLGFEPPAEYDASIHNLAEYKKAGGGRNMAVPGRCMKRVIYKAPEREDDPDFEVNVPVGDTDLIALAAWESGEVVMSFGSSGTVEGDLTLSYDEAMRLAKALLDATEVAGCKAFKA